MEVFLDRPGIAGIEISLPESKISISQMAAMLNVCSDQLFEEINVREKPYLESNQEIIDLGIHATKCLLKKLQIDPCSIDVIIHASCGIFSKQLWSPAAKIQQAINANKAFSFDIQNGCNSGNLALNLASQILLEDCSKQNILIVSSDFLSHLIDYKNPLHKCIFSFSDAASAIIVNNKCAKNLILAFSASSDARFADNMYYKIRDQYIWMNDDPKEDEQLIQAYEERYFSMINASLNKINGKITQVKAIIMNQGDHKLINKLINKLGVEEDFVYRSHVNYGHMGNTDIFFGLNQLIEHNKLSSGDLVILASSAIGFSWGASIIQI